MLTKRSYIIYWFIMDSTWFFSCGSNAKTLNFHVFPVWWHARRGDRWQQHLSGDDASGDNWSRRGRTVHDGNARRHGRHGRRCCSAGQSRPSCGCSCWFFQKKGEKRFSVNHHFLLDMIWKKKKFKKIIVLPLSKSSALQQTLKTTFMLWDEHRPPMRRCKSSLDDVAIEKKRKKWLDITNSNHRNAARQKKLSRFELKNLNK